MKSFWITICVVLWLVTIGFGIAAAVIDQQVGINMANLQLADDASTPEQKAKFLRAFLADMDRARLPEHAAWVWKSERNKIANQRIVLESLIKRCDDLSTLNKESMGYSQGMTQITGQEFDHVLKEVGSIYAKGFEMSYGWFPLNAWWIIGVVSLIVSAGAFFYAVENW